MQGSAVHPYHQREGSRGCTAPACWNSAPTRWDKHLEAEATCLPKLVFWQTSPLSAHTKGKKTNSALAFKEHSFFNSGGSEAEGQQRTADVSPIPPSNITPNSPFQNPESFPSEQTRCHVSLVWWSLFSTQAQMHSADGWPQAWPILRISLISLLRPADNSSSLCYDKTWPLTVVGWKTKA